MPRANAATQVVVQNAAKTLLANIRFASVDTPVHTLVITSSVPNEGKSTVCVNLAEAIATSGKSVLLVECDMRRRSLADLLGVHARTGIYGVLAEQSELEDAVVATGVKGMYFLDAEPHIPNPADILSSRRFRRFGVLLACRDDFAARILFEAVVEPDDVAVAESDECRFHPLPSCFISFWGRDSVCGTLQ